MANKEKNGIAELFFTMLKIGLFTFGGGYAMISLLRNELVTRKKWLDADEFLDVVAIAESTPGPIAINSSTYIGYKRAGVPGAVAATAGVCIPSLVIIYTISLFFDAFLSFAVIANAFRGIQACVVYLILSAGIKMLKDVKKDPISLILLVGTVTVSIMLSLFSVSFSSIYYIIIGAFVGLVIYFINKIKNSGTRNDGEGGEKK